MHLIIGHTTYDSAWIWVRGDRNDRRLEVTLEALNPADDDKGPHCELIEVDAKRDYTGIVRFDSKLKDSAVYKVLLRSCKTGDEVDGRLRTFPKPGVATSFNFLHGSCNLSTARLTALGSMAVGLLGSGAMRKALRLPFSEWEAHRIPRCLRFLTVPCLRPLALKGLRQLARLPAVVMALTRFEQPEPMLPSPFEKIRERVVDPKSDHVRPAFMMHCGDQIYFDLDFPPRRGKLNDFRRNYRQAWFEDESMKTLLTEMPHYMILDDHEVSDGFGMGTKVDSLREPALAAYDEYVGARQPRSSHSDGFYYTFAHGNAGFFVLDTRTERSVERAQMIGERQEKELNRWLASKDHPLKFIVSSVPFVAQLRPSVLGQGGERLVNEQVDKWSGDAWKKQRGRIIAAMYANRIERLVFLVGDMHCTYHARMQIGDARRRFTVHELAGGPINQLQFGKRRQFYARYSGDFVDQKSQAKLPWTSTLEAFHGAAPTVLEVSVRQQKDASLEVIWKALSTHRDRPRRQRSPISRHERAEPHDLSGRIRFPRKTIEVA